MSGFFYRTNPLLKHIRLPPPGEQNIKSWVKDKKSSKISQTWQWSNGNVALSCASLIIKGRMFQTSSGSHASAVRCGAWEVSAELQWSIKSSAVTGLAVDFPTVDEHVVKEISHWFMALCTLTSEEELVIVIVNTEHVRNMIYEQAHRPIIQNQCELIHLHLVWWPLYHQSLRQKVSLTVPLQRLPCRYRFPD